MKTRNSPRPHFLAVGIGGALGGGLRHGLTLLPGADYPAAILTINAVGAFLLPLITALLLHKLRASERVRLAVGTGAISSFTTFSALSGELVSRVHAGEFLWAGSYLGLTLVIGLGAAALGHVLSQRLIPAGSHDG